MSDTQLSDKAADALRHLETVPREHVKDCLWQYINELTKAGFVYLNPFTEPWIIRSAAGDQWVRDHPEPATFAPTPSQLALLKYYETQTGSESFIHDDRVALQRAGLITANNVVTPDGRNALRREGKSI